MGSLYGRYAQACVIPFILICIAPLTIVISTLRFGNQRFSFIIKTSEDHVLNKDHRGKLAFRINSSRHTKVPPMASYDAFALAKETTESVVVPMVLKAAIELDLLEIIARAGPDAQLSPVVIASQLQTQNPDAPEMVDRIMKLLASYSFLTCSLVTHDDGRVERFYGLAPVSTYFLATQHSLPFTDILKAFYHKALLQCWHHIKDAVLEGGTPSNKVHGISVYDFAALDPSFNEPFNTRMLKATKIIMSGILEKYKGFENTKVVVDVGGGIGVTIQLITSEYPNIKCINFDLPHVIQNSPVYPGIPGTEQIEVPHGALQAVRCVRTSVQDVSGDMLVAVPTGDIIFLKNVLHNWRDDDGP